jgi:MFS transporter, UMF1 family
MTDSDRVEAPELRPPLAVGGRIKRWMVLSWAMWDWGSSAYSAVITSFVFGPYVVRGVVGDAQPGGLTANTWLGISTAAAGLLVAAIAPITGQRADAGGHRKRNLAIWSGLVIAVMLGMFSVKNEPSYLWIALVLLAAGAVFQEFAVVSYNAMLPQVSTPETIGRVSGFGWAMGYFGGIFLLLICYVGFIAPEVGWFGVTSAGGLNIRAVVIFSAIWFAVFAIPVLLAVPESPPGPSRRRVGFFASYRLLVNDIKALFKRDRNSVYFLIASALYRDGLAAIFSFGAILAVSVYGMAQSTVLIFGIAANVVAALGALGMGAIEDRIGPKKVIMISLVGLITTSLILLFAHGTTMFWVFGLILTLWVGPLLRFVHRPRRYRGHRSGPTGRRTRDGRCEAATKPTTPGLRIRNAESWLVGIGVRNISARPRVEPVGLEKRQATVDGGCAHG